MKLRIEKTRRVVATNIDGQPVEFVDEYRVYRRLLFGLKAYLCLYPSLDLRNLMPEKFFVMYAPKRIADVYDHDTAQKLVEEVEKNPNRFIRKV